MKPRLLIDENLPDGLANALGEECVHAIELGERPTDDALWRYAQREGGVILTKDADFFNKLTRRCMVLRRRWCGFGPGICAGLS